MVPLRDIYLAGQRIQLREGKKLGTLLPGGPDDGRFRAAFGGPASLARRAWTLIQPLLSDEHKVLEHFLLALKYMKVYSKSDKEFCASVGGMDTKTLHKRIAPYVDALFELNYDEIKMENRFVGDTFNDCLMSVDGVDFDVAKSYDKDWWSYKFKHSGLRYEIGLCIKTGQIVWWHGPFLPGMFNDEMVFQEGLAQELGPGERVETDKGYVGSTPHWTRIPDGMEHPDRSEMTAKVRLRHETCNKRVKQWGILKYPYRHDVMRHQTYFGAILTITNLAFVDEPLFPVEYED